MLVFDSNQGASMIKSLVQRSITFNVYYLMQCWQTTQKWAVWPLLSLTLWLTAGFVCFIMYFKTLWFIIWDHGRCLNFKWCVVMILLPGGPKVHALNVLPSLVQCRTYFLKASGTMARWQYIRFQVECYQGINYYRFSFSYRALRYGSHGHHLAHKWMSEGVPSE